MNNGNLNWIANFIWSIADNVVPTFTSPASTATSILPITVLRRLDDVQRSV